MCICEREREGRERQKRKERDYLLPYLHFHFLCKWLLTATRKRVKPLLIKSDKNQSRYQRIKVESNQSYSSVINSSMNPDLWTLRRIFVWASCLVVKVEFMKVCVISVSQKVLQMTQQTYLLTPIMSRGRVNYVSFLVSFTTVCMFFFEDNK